MKLSIWLLGLLLTTSPLGLMAKNPELSAGVLTLEAGDYKLDFREQAAWTIGNLIFRGQTLISYTGGNQTVINVVVPVQTDPAAWIGTSHGREEIESVVLQVDGVDYPLGEGFSAPAGDKYVLLKKSRIGPYTCLSATGFSAEGVTQQLQFAAEGGVDEVRYAYVFMHCWGHQLNQWLAVLPGNFVVQERFPEVKATSLKQPVLALALFSEASGIGALLEYDKPYEGEQGHSNFLINWPNRHNKHYLRVTPEQLAGSQFFCRISGFNSSVEEWPQRVEQILQERQKTTTEE